MGADGRSQALSPRELDELCINTIRFLSVDAVQKADSGHPGLPLGAAPMAYVLWTRFLKFNPADPQWFDRDRFVLSAGHGSMLLYSLLHLTGFALSLEDLQHFREWESRAPGHPERGATPGVEVTTGPLGQGFANGVGMAIAEAHLAARFNREGLPVVDHATYALVSDGDLMEGVASEAASLAGHLKLGKLVYLYDDNRVTLGAGTHITFTEDCARRFTAYGWQTLTVEDGNDLASVERALREARVDAARPSLILVRTHIGYGSPHLQDSYKAHGAALGEEEVRLTKQRLDWPPDPLFLVPEPARAHLWRAVEKGRKAQEAWSSRKAELARRFPDLAQELDRIIQAERPAGWEASIPQFPADSKGLATRVASGKVLTALAERIPEIIGGSGDLDPSTHTAIQGAGDFESPGEKGGDMQGSAGGGWSYAGRNLHFGVREHAMGAILNGLAAHGGLIPYGATFLIFSDYMRPAMRLASIMRLPALYVFTHDSIALGEDGPTHQPVEQLANLRAIPGLVVVRPCDANEVAAAWKYAIGARDHPVALVLTRQKVPTLDRAGMGSADGLLQGAYVLAEAGSGRPRLLIIATGSEVSLALQARAELEKRGVATRVVSMPSWELFADQPRSYRDSVLPKEVRARLAVEAGSPQGWCRWVGDRGEVLGVDHFGASAPGGEVLRRFGFTAENVVSLALRALERAQEG